MALLKKAPKEEPTFKPTDLDQLSREEEDRKKGFMSMFAVKRTGSQLIITKAMRRAAAALIALLLLLMGSSYLIAAMIIRSGSFIVSIMDDIDDEYAISLSETPEFLSPTTVLKGKPVDHMDNITYEWIGDDYEGSVDGVDSVDGSHNGANYVAYTFYVKSAGKKACTYDADIEVVGVSKGIDEAVRVMVYKNGEPTIYAKPVKGTADTLDYGADENFIDDKIVMRTRTMELEPGEMDKYTIVVWLEGWDPECVNDVLGGIMKMEMNFTVILPED